MRGYVRSSHRAVWPPRRERLLVPTHREPSFTYISNRRAGWGFSSGVGWAGGTSIRWIGAVVIGSCIWGACQPSAPPPKEPTPLEAAGPVASSSGDCPDAASSGQACSVEGKQSREENLTTLHLLRSRRSRQTCVASTNMVRQPSLTRTWLVPMATLAAIAVFAFGFLYTVDHYFTGGPASAASADSARRYFFFDQDHITDAVSALGGMIAGVLGIVITVVSLLVQLSAERYTGVTGMFLRDRTNITVMAFYVVTCVCGVARQPLASTSTSCRALALLAMMATVRVRPRDDGCRTSRTCSGSSSRSTSSRASSARRSDDRAAAASSDDRHAIAAVRPRRPRCRRWRSSPTSPVNSISGKDKIIASRAVDAIKDFVVDYLAVKNKASPRWFEIGDGIRDNPDFVAMDPESLRDLESIARPGSSGRCCASTSASTTRRRAACPTSTT